jgi:hypothetical protein
LAVGRHREKLGGKWLYVPNWFLAAQAGVPCR